MSAQTVGGALRNVIIESGLIGSAVFLDFAPTESQAIPYVTYNDTISLAPLMRGDGRTMFYGRDMQVNLWQKDNEEDMFLPGKLVRALDGAKLYMNGVSFTPRVKVLSCTRLADNASDQLVHHEITVSITNPREAI